MKAMQCHSMRWMLAVSIRWHIDFSNIVEMKSQNEHKYENGNGNENEKLLLDEN